ncbi:MAG: hypothetical protein RRB22_10795 [Gammaproteobacteria bacterium]|nr:hypothetical protein [Gammaproteobacteria bacterium]
MANGILKTLNRSLEISLRDNLDGLREFTLMMASRSVRPPFEVLPAEPGHSASAPPAAPPLTLLERRPRTAESTIHYPVKRRA